MPDVAVLAGGVGAARFLTGLLEVVDATSVTAIVNVGDDTELHGLHVSPDLDTVTYTLAGAVNPETGWGLAGETWQAMDALAALDPDLAWFRLGDRDIGTHLFRTDRLHDGATLSSVTAEIAARFGLGLHVLPATDDRLRTMVTLADGREVDFQSYFVAMQHDVAVRSVRFDGAESTRPAPGVLEAIAGADVVVIAPSNPFVSIAPVLAVSGVEAAVTARRDHVVAVSPIVAGAALKGPADRLLRDFGHEASVVGIARIYATVAGTLVIDEADSDLAGAVEAEGMRCVVTRTIMREPGVAASLARAVLDG